jgi:hypothetical protein
MTLFFPFTLIMIIAGSLIYLLQRLFLVFGMWMVVMGTSLEKEVSGWLLKWFR